MRLLLYYDENSENLNYIINDDNVDDNKQNDY